MKKIIMAVIAVAVSTGVVNALELENMSAKDVAKMAQETKVPEARYGQIVDVTRDCKKISFGAADPLISPEISLASRETTQDCQNMGYPVGQICTTNIRNYRENVKVVITEPRVLQPDQKEVFEVCLWGPFLNLKQVSPAYKYAVRQVPGAFELTPETSATKAPAQDVCTLAMDTNYSCIYRCKDGSFISVPNPFGPPPFPGTDFPMHGCRPSVPNTPLITIIGK
ncbi:MAG: hypothetical protein Q7R35_15640 [Elusimicrobiota bacterium]|nr:hypothetical protein [Elusimicrobiota bacterium]